MEGSNKRGHKRSKNTRLKEKYESFFDNDAIPPNMPLSTEEEKIIDKMSIHDLYHASDRSDNLSVPYDALPEEKVKKLWNAIDRIDEALHDNGLILTEKDIKDPYIKESLPLSIRDHKHDFIDIDEDVKRLVFTQLKLYKKNEDQNTYDCDTKIDLIQNGRAVSTLHLLNEYRIVDTHIQSQVSEANFESKPIKFDLCDHMLSRKNEIGCKALVIYISRYMKLDEYRIVVEYSFCESTAFLLCEGYSYRHDKKTNENLPEVIKNNINNRIIIRERANLYDFKNLEVMFSGYCYLFCNCVEITGK